MTSCACSSVLDRALTSPVPLCRWCGLPEAEHTERSRFHFEAVHPSHYQDRSAVVRLPSGVVRRAS